MIEETVLTPQSKPEDIVFENTLRPQTLTDYIGQDSIKKNLEILLEASKKRKDVLDHIILYGPPGLGKTTLAHIIAKEMGVHIKVTSGPAIGKGGDLAAILTNLQPGDILFIDEIHRLPRQIEEILYPAMEDFAIDLVVGKGPSARTLRLDIPKITIIGATTRLSLLSAALRDRFGVQYHFQFYDNKDIEKIITRSASVLETGIVSDAVNEIARRCRKTPRIANRLLKRIRDYALVKSDGTISKDVATAALNQLEIDQHGLDRIDREILHIIIEKFQGGPVGVGTIAAATGEEVETIEEVYEPFLIQMGFLHRTQRGRMVTPRAYEHLCLPVPQAKLV